MAAFTALLEVGKYALISTVTASMGIGILASGVETIRHTQSLFSDDNGKPTWQKARDLALALIGFIGISCVTLEWVQFLGWISLGVAAPVVAFVGYPAFAIVNGALAFYEFQALYRLFQERDTPLFGWKVTAKTLHTLSKTCLVAVSVLGGIAFLTGCSPVAVATFITLIVAFLLLGSAKVFDYNIASRQRQERAAQLQ